MRMEAQAGGMQDLQRRPSQFQPKWTNQIASGTQGTAGLGDKTLAALVARVGLGVAQLLGSGGDAGEGLARLQAGGDEAEAARGAARDALHAVLRADEA